MDFSLCTSMCRKSAGVGAWAGAGGVETGAGRVETGAGRVETGAGRIETGAARVETCTDDSSGNCNENRCNP